MKKIILTTIIITLSLTLIGCGKEKEKSPLDELGESLEDLENLENLFDTGTEEDENKDKNNDEINLYSDDKKLVFDYEGLYKIVYYFEGNEITGQESYYDYGNETLASYAYTTLKASQDETVESIKQNGRYVIIKYKESVYENLTVEEVKENYAYLEQVYENGAIETNENNNKESNENANTSNEGKKLLSKVGLSFTDIEPSEKYYKVEFDEDDKEFTFYMEKGTEKNVGKYLTQLYNAGKNASKDNKIYKTSFAFYMNDGTAEEYIPKTESEINSSSSYSYIDQFGYYYGNGTIDITFASASDMDGDKDDDIYYPIYSVSIGW